MLEKGNVKKGKRGAHTYDVVPTYGMTWKSKFP